MSKAIQYFSKEYLERCKGMTPEQIVRFLDDWRIMFAARAQQDKPGKQGFDAGHGFSEKVKKP